MEQTFGAKPLTSLNAHQLGQYRECLEACMEEADLQDYVSMGMGWASGQNFMVGDVLCNDAIAVRWRTPWIELLSYTA